MIKGRYGDTSGRPYVEGRLTIPSQKLNTDISFVLDTGADTTVVMPMDGAKLGIDYAKLETISRSLGVGGYSQDFIEPALLTFRGTSGTLYVYKINAIISSPSPDIMKVPSLLGRNIINRWRINYDPQMDILDCEVGTADNAIGPKAAPRR